MSKYPPPNREGHFWAKLVHPFNQPEGEDWKSITWEVVAVWDNNGEGDEIFTVHVPGIGPSQWIPDFIWGPEVIKPVDLK